MSEDMGRRSAMRALFAGAAGMLLAPGVLLVAGGEADAGAAGTGASPNKRWGLLIDTSRCPDGCSICVDACRTEHGWQGHGDGPTEPQWIRKVEFTATNGGPTRAAPVMCQHCANPPCVQVCPTTASFKRADGIVLVDRHRCIGCRYCMMACPFKARSFVHEAITDQREHMPRGKGTVESCTLCVHRIDAGRLPACVEACAEKSGAMLFGDLNDPTSAIAQAVKRHGGIKLRPDLGLDAGVSYVGL